MTRRQAWFDGQLDLDPARLVFLDETWASTNMDNLSSHKGPRVRDLPPHSPDFNPIEMAFAKLKALLCKAAERTIGALWDRIGVLLDAFAPDECANYFEAVGYRAT